MLEALKHSTEPEHLIAEAQRYLKGLKGNLVQLKKKQEVKKMERVAQRMRTYNQTGYPQTGYPQRGYPQTGYPPSGMMPEWQYKSR